MSFPDISLGVTIRDISLPLILVVGFCFLIYLNTEASIIASIFLGILMVCSIIALLDNYLKREKAMRSFAGHGYLS